MKTYAQLVNVDADDVLVDYYQLTRATIVPPVVSARPKAAKELSTGPWIAVIVIVIIVVSAFWWFTRSPEPLSEVQLEETLPAEVPQDESPAPPDSDEIVEQIERQQSAPQQSAPQQTAPQVVEPVIREESQPEVQDEPVIEAGQLHVLVTYTGDCWTEITDANGRRLLFDLGKDGRTVELRGAEPFNVLFGNPGNVSLRVNGEERALPPTLRPDRPMRLTLSGA